MPAFRVLWLLLFYINMECIEMGHVCFADTPSHSTYACVNVYLLFFSSSSTFMFFAPLLRVEYCVTVCVLNDEKMRWKEVTRKDSAEAHIILSMYIRMCWQFGFFATASCVSSELANLYIAKVCCNMRRCPYPSVGVPTKAIFPSIERAHAGWQHHVTLNLCSDFQSHHVVKEKFIHSR